MTLSTQPFLEPSIEELVSNREAFNAFVYTPLEEALEEIERRWNDPSIPDYVPVPDILKEGYRAVIFRQLLTPNYEVRRFFSIVDSIKKLEPLFWEYYEDKYTSNNEWKHSLGKLFFHEGVGKKGGAKVHSLTILDFNKYNGKKISEVHTLWGEPLTSFHHKFFEERFRELGGNFFDASNWFKENGGTASNYYPQFLMLFIKHGILFENFMLDEKELSFTKETFLPAFIEIIKKTGHKPLIVSLEPTDIEGDKFWICHPFIDKEGIEHKMTRSGDSV